MSNELVVALEISDHELANNLMSLVRRVKGVQTQLWSGSISERGNIAIKTSPDVILINDTSEGSPLLARIRSIKSIFPQTSLFVVSDNLDPQNIIDVMKAGATEYLVNPVTEQILVNAIEEVRIRLANSGRLGQGKIYSFISAKGGLGATALAVNTAAALGMDKNSSVALLDMALHSGDVSVLLDIVPETTILDICRNMHRLDVAFLRGAMTSHSSGINFLAAPQNPEDAESIRGEHVASILELALCMYNHIVIDCSSMHVSECTIEAFRLSDKVFIVTDMSVPSVRNAARLSKLIRKMGIRLEKIEIVVNRFLKDNILSIADIEKNLDKPVYWMVPNDFSEILTSINRGVPLVKLNGASPFSRNIVQFTRKFQNQLEDPGFRGIRGLFGKTL